MDLGEIVEAADREQRLVEQIFQEELQKTILTGLSREELFQRIVFQGGTALRLFYGNPRFSEDLDFVLKEGASKVNLDDYIPQLQRFTEDTFTFLDETDLKMQKDSTQFQRLILKAKSDSLPKTIRLHLELAQVPSYLNSPLILDFTPFNPAIRVEKRKEILADKITALLCRDYLKGRDIWDIYYLNGEGDVEISWNLVDRKIRDYGFENEDLTRKREETLQRLDEEGHKILDSELKRFLPQPQYNQYQDIFDNILLHSINVLKGADLSGLKEG